VNRPPMPILYEDNHLLVVEKPVNMPSQEDESRDPDVLTVMKDWIKVRDGKPGNVYLGLVHRLDRPVGGAMVLAKTSKAASRLSDAIRTRSIGKEYVAVVRGCPPEREATLVHYLWKDPARHIVYAVRKNHKQAKEAVLDYRVIGTLPDAGAPEFARDVTNHGQAAATGNHRDRKPHGAARTAVREPDRLSLVRVRLHTGRTHQIRVQMAQIGCPLYGDQKYGAARNKPGQQLALWSALLAFNHPVGKREMRFVSTPPRLFPWDLWDERLYREDAGWGVSES